MVKRASFIGGLVPVLVFFSSQALAMSFESMAPRTLGMGGGVASGEGVSVALQNPALLVISRQKENVRIEFPIIVNRFSDPDGLLDIVDEYQFSAVQSKLHDSIVEFYDSGAPNVRIVDSTDTLLEVKTAAQDIADAAQSVKNQLEKLSGRIFQGEHLSAMAVAIPNKRFAAVLSVNTYTMASGEVRYTDQVLLQGLVDDATTTANANDQEQLDALEENSAVANQKIPVEDTDIEPVDVVDTLTSNLKGRGAIVSELGISLSQMVTLLGHDFALGVTPKLVKVETFDYVLGIETADFDTDRGTKEYIDFNVDVGLVKAFAGGWKGGVVIKNLFGKHYATVPYSSISELSPVPAKIRLEPQVRLGVSHSSKWVSLVADLDVTENVSAGYEPESQYLGLGAEVTLFDLVNLRMGYRYNLSDADTSIPSLGFGFSPFGAFVDVAYASNGDEDIVAFQLGLRF